jgi:hypothetical protein
MGRWCGLRRHVFLSRQAASVQSGNPEIALGFDLQTPYQERTGYGEQGDLPCSYISNVQASFNGTLRPQIRGEGVVLCNDVPSCIIIGTSM